MNENFSLHLDKTKFSYGDVISWSLQLHFFEPIKVSEISIILEEFSISPKSRGWWWSRWRYNRDTKYVVSRVTIPGWEYQTGVVPFELKIPQESMLHYEYLYKDELAKLPEWLQTIIRILLGAILWSHRLKTYKIIAEMHIPLGLNKKVSQEVNIVSNSQNNN